MLPFGRRACYKAALPARSRLLCRTIQHRHLFVFPVMAKRKRSVAAITPVVPEASPGDRSKLRRTEIPLPSNVTHKPTRRQSNRGTTTTKTNPDENPDVLDGVAAMRASPDGHECATSDPHMHNGTGTALEAATNGIVSAQIAQGIADDLPNQQKRKKSGKAGPRQVKAEHGANAPTGAIGVTESVTAPTRDSGAAGHLEAGEDMDTENADEGDIKAALSRPPPVNSEYLPLPWKGRLGYACLNTYLRNANPPVFSSRTCRIASILEHRHPLKDPSQPEHATKNRPDRDQPADVARGQRYVEELGLANARDVSKMLRWNDKYGIKFMRLSSEMFPFASHDEYGYKLESFAAETLREVGKVVAELGHRVTTHPGQFTQLGSPRKQVIDNAIRDLEYHDELLSLLKLPPQQNRDAVMILHLGGAFGDKPSAIERFKENYARLSQSIKNRLVLENDDVVWSVHELLPLCQELNIPMVLDFHHHNIIFDSTQLREGTRDIMDVFPAILETWSRKGITPKMHYSESCPDAITGRQRRKHSPRVMTLPPCPDTMDLMIEAKDKEQAVFELMRTFKLPGFQTFNDIIPHQRADENRPWKPKPKKAAKKGKKKQADELEELDVKLEEAEDEDVPPPVVSDEEVGMGGPEGRVYWPPGMEEWLRPPKRVIKKKEEGTATPAAKKRKPAANAVANAEAASNASEEVVTPAKKAPKRAASTAKRKASRAVPTPSPSDDDEQLSSPPLSDVGSEDDASEIAPSLKRGARPASTRTKSGRAAGRVSYKEEDLDELAVE